MPTAPNVENYTLGKGVVTFDDGSGARDLGNTPNFTISVTIEKLEHFSSRGGIMAKDKEVITKLSPSVAFTLDEFSAENINMFFMGTVSGPADEKEIKAFMVTELEGELTFTSDNPVGTNQEITIHKVVLTPDGDVSMIGDDWGTMSFTGEVLKDSTGHPSSPYMDITVLSDSSS